MSVDVAGPFWHVSSSSHGLAMMVDTLLTGVRRIAVCVRAAVRILASHWACRTLLHMAPECFDHSATWAAHVIDWCCCLLGSCGVICDWMCGWAIGSVEWSWSLRAGCTIVVQRWTRSSRPPWTGSRRLCVAPFLAELDQPWTQV